MGSIGDELRAPGKSNRGGRAFKAKIDKAFVNYVDLSASGGAVANAILSLGKSLDLIVTAEGIERSGQLEWLRSRGCDEAQGFLLSRPLSAEDLENRYLLAADAQQDVDTAFNLCLSQSPNRAR